MSPRNVLLIRQLIVGTMIVAFFGMLITSVWYVTRLEAMTISKVTVSGGETIAPSEIEAIVKQELAGNYLKLVPYSFAFAYPHETIIAKIRENDRVNTVSIIRSGGTELVIEFDEYLPHALWCKEGDDSSCLFLDENGYAFGTAPGLKGGSFLRFTSIGREPAEHTQAFAAEEYRRAEELVAAFLETKWIITKVEIDAASDAYMNIAGGGEFKVSLKQPTTETIANLETVLGSEQFAHLTPGNFEYVDLRFGSKVFVNEETIDRGEQGTSTPTGTDAGGGELPPASDSDQPTPPPAYASEPSTEPTSTPEDAVTVTFDPEEPQ